MTLTEARKIARITATADGGCSACVRDLVDKLNDAALGYQFTMSAVALHFRSEWDDPGERSGRYPFIKVLPAPTAPPSASPPP